MPKSRRNKLVTLSHAKRKGREHKESIIQSVRAAAEAFEALYVFEYDTMRNNLFKELREELKDSCRFFLGSNKVLQLALGKDAATELRDGMHQCAQVLEGQRGLLFTNLPHDEISRKISDFAHPDYARSGSPATETVELEEGPLQQFSHEMEPFLRKQGMPVRLNRGTVELLGNFTVCRKGEPLSPESATLLRLLGIQMAVFRLHLVARWGPDSFEAYEVPPAEGQGGGDSDQPGSEDEGHGQDLGA